MASNKRRRASYVAALAAASALLLSACGGETTADPGAGEATAAAGEFPTTGSGVVNLYNWTDYIDPELLDKFEADTGIEVILDIPAVRVLGGLIIVGGLGLVGGRRVVGQSGSD